MTPCETTCDEKFQDFPRVFPKRGAERLTRSHRSAAASERAVDLAKNRNSKRSTSRARWQVLFFSVFRESETRLIRSKSFD